MTDRISRLQLVVIPTADQDRSIAFYEQLGFEKSADAPWADGHRWVEMYPPDGKAGIAIVPGEGGVATGIILNTTTIEATHADLRGVGLDVDETIAREGAGVEIAIGSVRNTSPAPPMFYVRDPDGNSLLVVEAPF
jgi:catechol 2,3-dioxygenase-like lactoylglutathione lyase family enzyme